MQIQLRTAVLTSVPMLSLWERDRWGGGAHHRYSSPSPPYPASASRSRKTGLRSFVVVHRADSVMITLTVSKCLIWQIANITMAQATTPQGAIRVFRFFQPEGKTEHTIFLLLLVSGNPCTGNCSLQGTGTNWAACQHDTCGPVR